MPSPIGQGRLRLPSLHRSSSRRRPYGVRLYLAIAFAAVALITAGLAYLLVSDTGERAADEELTQLAVGRTVGLAGELGVRRQRAADATLAGATDEGYAAWVFNDDGRLVTERVAEGVPFRDVRGGRRAVRAALAGRQFVDDQPGASSVVAVPIFRNAMIKGAVLARSTRSSEVQEAIEAVRGDRFTALAIAVVVAVIISFLIASAITSRVKRLAGRWRQCARRCAALSGPCAPSATDSRRSSTRSTRRSWSSIRRPGRCDSQTPRPRT
jgi:hypothetical protein